MRSNNISSRDRGHKSKTATSYLIIPTLDVMLPPFRRPQPSPAKCNVHFSPWLASHSVVLIAAAHVFFLNGISVFPPIATAAPSSNLQSGFQIPSNFRALHSTWHHSHFTILGFGVFPEPRLPLVAFETTKLAEFQHSLFLNGTLGQNLHWYLFPRPQNIITQYQYYFYDNPFFFSHPPS